MFVIDFCIVVKALVIAYIKSVVFVVIVVIVIFFKICVRSSLSPVFFIIAFLLVLGFELTQHTTVVTIVPIYAIAANVADAIFTCSVSRRSGRRSSSIQNIVGRCFINAVRQFMHISNSRKCSSLMY
uniref:Uncharacterized protein n=1 Tax=Lygus hesperus TaxID=30085 RepID=A0A146LWH5_LYGHE